MAEHQFLLQPGEWVGEGNIEFSESDQVLFFHTLWQVHAKEDRMLVRHTVELVGVAEKVVNTLEVYNIQPDSFAIELSNDMVQKIRGKGVVDSAQLSWEFRGEPGFEGFELYKLQEDNGYDVHAEYLSSEQFRTIIHGSIWKRSKKDDQ